MRVFGKLGRWVVILALATSRLMTRYCGLLVTGAMCSVRALAAFARMALVSSQLNKDAEFAPAT